MTSEQGRYRSHAASLPPRRPCRRALRGRGAGRSRPVLRPHHASDGAAGRASSSTTGSTTDSIILAVVGVAARAVLVRAERVAWSLMAIGLVPRGPPATSPYTFAYGDYPPYPSVADAFYLAFYPLAYVALILLVRTRVSRPNASVWFDGLAAALATAAVGAALLVDLVHETTGGSTGGCGHQPLLPARRRAPPRDRRRGLLADPLAPGPGLGRDRRGARRDGRGRLRLPVPDRRRHLRRRHGRGRALARLDAPDRARRLAARPARAGRRAVRPAASRHARVRRALGARNPRLRPLRATERAGGRPCGRGGPRRLPAHGSHLPRKHAHPRREPGAGRDGLAHRARQPPQAPGRPRACLHRSGADAVRPGHLRPRRVQALQRLVRPPGRRCAAPPARRQAGVDPGAPWSDVPPRRRRVLRPRGRTGGRGERARARGRGCARRGG